MRKHTGRLLLTVAEAAEALGVSDRHIKRLIHEADCNRKSRWRWGRELVDLSPVGSQRRTVRINPQAVLPNLVVELLAPDQQSALR
jgi:hypothetical protein